MSLRERATGAGDPRALLIEIDDALPDGYVQALAGDAWSRRSEQRLQELITHPDLPVRGPELRRLVAEHDRFGRELIALRRQLAGLRQDRDRLAAALRSASA